MEDGGGDLDEEEHGENEDGNKIHEEEDEDGSDHEDEDEDGDGDNLETFQERESEKTSPLNFEVIVVHDLCDHVRMHNHP